MLTKSNRITNIFAVLCLAGTGWACLATSAVDGSLYGSYHVKSDCVSPTYDNQVYVSNSTITTPSGTDFTTFGFPNATLKSGSESSGTVNGAQRVCKTALVSDKTTRVSYLYACADDGQFVCNIYLEEL